MELVTKRGLEPRKLQTSTLCLAQFNTIIGDEPMAKKNETPEITSEQLGAEGNLQVTILPKSGSWPKSAMIQFFIERLGKDPVSIINPQQWSTLKAEIDAALGIKPELFIVQIDDVNGEESQRQQIVLGDGDYMESYEAKYFFAIVKIDATGAHIVDDCYRSIEEAKAAWPEAKEPRQ